METRKIIDNAGFAMWTAVDLICSLAFPQGSTVLTIADPAKDLAASWRISRQEVGLDFTLSYRGDDTYAESMKAMIDNEYLDDHDVPVVRDFARAAYEAFGQLEGMPGAVRADLTRVKAPSIDLNHAVVDLCEAVLGWEAPGEDTYATFKSAGFSEENAMKLSLEHGRLVATAARLKKLYQEGKE